MTVADVKGVNRLIRCFRTNEIALANIHHSLPLDRQDEVFYLVDKIRKDFAKLVVIMKECKVLEVK